MNRNPLVVFVCLLGACEPDGSASTSVSPDVGDAQKPGAGGPEDAAPALDSTFPAAAAADLARADLDGGWPRDDARRMAELGVEPVEVDALPGPPRDALPEPDMALPSVEFCSANCDGPAPPEPPDGRFCPPAPAGRLECMIRDPHCPLGPNDDDPRCPVLGSVEAGIIVVVCCAAGLSTEPQPGNFVCLDTETGDFDAPILGERCEFDTEGRLTLRTNDWGDSARFAYDAAGRIVRWEEMAEGEDGHLISTCAYDYAGRVTSRSLHTEREPDGDWGFLRMEECARYDSAGRVVQTASVTEEDSQDLGHQMWAERCTPLDPEADCARTVVCRPAADRPLIAACGRE